MQPLSVELTDVNRRSYTKLTVKVQGFRLSGEKLNGSANRAKILTISYKAIIPKRLTSKQRYTSRWKFKKTFPKKQLFASYNTEIKRKLEGMIVDLRDKLWRSSVKSENSKRIRLE